MENEKIFSTRDIYLAATLVTLRFYLEGIDYQIEGERQRPVGYFNFEKTENLEETEKKYWAGKLSVEPNSYMMNLRSLKARVNGAYKSPRSNFTGSNN